MDRRFAKLIFRAFRKADHLNLLPRVVDHIRPSALTISTGVGRLRVPWRFVLDHAQRDYEPLTQASMSKLVKPGMTFLDVGAHIGWLTLLASRLVGEQGQVIAVEPFEENFEFLRENLSLNNRGNVKLLRCAASNEDGTRTFHLTSSSDSNSFYEHPNVKTEREIEVEVRKVDTFAPDRLDAAKIDVEGAELLVLDGMTKTIAANPQLVMWVEWMPKCLIAAGFTPMSLPRRLRALGFHEIDVLDDLRGKTFSVEDIEVSLARDELPQHWYANLLARRPQK